MLAGRCFEGGWLSSRQEWLAKMRPGTGLGTGAEPQGRGQDLSSIIQSSFVSPAGDYTLVSNIQLLL